MPAQSAYDRLRELFASYGLPDAPDIVQAITEAAQEGESERPDLVQARLEQTASWKQRFAGNEARRAKGMNVLSVAEYLQQENMYRQVMRNAGLPSGFYDQQSDFTDFISKDVSVQELQERVNLAGDIANREDPAVAAALASRGIDSGMLLAYSLDPDRALPLIKRAQNAVLIQAAGTRSGFGVDNAQADTLAERGIGESQAIQGFGQINDFYEPTKKLGDIYGETYGAEDALSEVFAGDSGEKRKRLARQEQSNFSGSTGYGVQRRSVAGRY